MASGGQKTARWTISTQEKLVGRNIHVFCSCSCGAKKWVRKSSLFKDSFACRSCSSGRASHRSSTTRLYKIWSAMKQRCSNKKSIGYHTYGGVGISVCAEWASSFSKFKAWAIGSGYDAAKTLDRLNNKLGYGPNNCKWSTPAEQSRNTCRNINLTIGGQTKIFKDWCAVFGVNYSSALHRRRGGESSELAILSLILKQTTGG